MTTARREDLVTVELLFGGLPGAWRNARHGMNLPGPALARSRFDPAPTDSTSPGRFLPAAWSRDSNARNARNAAFVGNPPPWAACYRSVTDRPAGAEPTDG